MPRKQHTYHFIYRTTCEITGNYYVGMHSTSNLEDGYIGSGKKLWLSIRKYGRESHRFEILEFLSNRETLRKREAEIVNEELLRDPRCMNMMQGGEGGFISEEQQKRRASAGGSSVSRRFKEGGEFAARISEKRSNDAKRLHESGRMKVPDWKGKTHKESTRQKIGESTSVSQSGERNSQFGTVWMKHDSLGVRKVRKEDVTLFQENGWKRGRK